MINNNFETVRSGEKNRMLVRAGLAALLSISGLALESCTKSNDTSKSSSAKPTAKPTTKESSSFAYDATFRIDHSYGKNGTMDTYEYQTDVGDTYLYSSFCEGKTRVDFSMLDNIGGVQSETRTINDPTCADGRLTPADYAK